MNNIDIAKQVFGTEIEALRKTRDSLGEEYLEILDAIIECKGKVIITGMGKPGHIAKKIAATLSSLGTPSFYLHPAEALHGDLGMITNQDIVIAISFSGESDEITAMMPGIRWLGAKLIAISGNKESTLVKSSDLSLTFPLFDEACHIGMAPTSSTTVALVLGDALAVSASMLNGFTKEDYGRRHPSGTLGKKILIKVSDAMHIGENNAVLHVHATIKEVIIELSKKMLGIVSLVDDARRLVGVITDGDLRRLLEREVDIYKLTVSEIMSLSPKWTYPDTLAVVALDTMKSLNISCLPVVDEAMHTVGTICVQDILKVGII